MAASRTRSALQYKGPKHSGRKVLISLRLDSAAAGDEGTTVLKGNSHSTLIRTSNDKELDQVGLATKIFWTSLKLTSLRVGYFLVR